MKSNLKRFLKYKLNQEKFDKLKSRVISLNNIVYKNIKDSSFSNKAKKNIAILKVELDIFNRKIHILNKRRISPYLNQRKIILNEFIKKETKKIYFFLNHNLLPKLNKNVEVAVNFLTIEQGEETWSNLDSSRKWNKIIIWTFVSFATFGIAWSIVARVDETVQSIGKLEPKGTTIDVKVPMGGVIEKILVKEGELVEKDQILLKLDTTAALNKTRALQVFRSISNRYMSDTLISDVNDHIAMLKERDRHAFVETPAVIWKIVQELSLKGILEFPEATIKSQIDDILGNGTIGMKERVEVFRVDPLENLLALDEMLTKVENMREVK